MCNVQNANNGLNMTYLELKIFFYLFLLWHSVFFTLWSSTVNKETPYSITGISHTTWKGSANFGCVSLAFRSFIPGLLIVLSILYVHSISHPQGNGFHKLQSSMISRMINGIISYTPLNMDQCRMLMARTRRLVML